MKDVWSYEIVPYVHDGMGGYLIKKNDVVLFSIIDNPTTLLTEEIKNMINRLNWLIRETE